MAKTTISDLAIVPVDFQAYVEKLILERSGLFTSGLMAMSPAFIPAKGKVTNAPAYLGLTGDDEVLSDSSALTVQKVNSVNAVSVINFRGKAFSANDLVGVLAGVDPLGNLASKVADYWVRMGNRVAYNTLKGAVIGMDADYGAGSVISDQSGSAITSSLVLDTIQLFGEYSDTLDLIVMHSAVRTKLQKNDLLADVVIDSIGTRVETYLGRRVVVDDLITSVPTASPVTNVYTTYLAAAGAILYADGTSPDTFIETDRDILAGDDIFSTRKRFITHVAGTSWSGSAAGVSPTNAELAVGSNWNREDTSDDKRFPVRAIKHLI